MDNGNSQFTQAIRDAARILGVDGQLNAELIKAGWRAACKKYHPDINPAGETMMKMVNAAYDILKGFEGEIFPIREGVADYGEALNAALAQIVKCFGLEIEVSGSWMWVGGETKQHRATLRAANFRWHGSKKKWYFRPPEYRSFKHKEWSMSKIRDRYGSQTVKTDPNEQVAAERS